MLALLPRGLKYHLYVMIMMTGNVCMFKIFLTNYLMMDPGLAFQSRALVDILYLLFAT